MRRLLRPEWIICACVVCLALSAPAAFGQAAIREEAVTDFEMAMGYYRKGEFEAANTAFGRLLGMKLTREEARAMREKAGGDALVDMLLDPQTADIAREILRKAEELAQEFDAAMKLYRQGEYEAAAKGFERVLEMNPSTQEALVLREMAGMNTLVKLLRDPAAAPMAREILRKAAEEVQVVRRDPETLKKTMEALGSDEYLARVKAIRYAVAAGPFAVPYLLDYALSDEEPTFTSRRSAALVALRRMGAAAVPPMLVALRHADVEASTKIAGFLAFYPDARAIPTLMAISIADDTPPALKVAVEQTLEQTRDAANPARTTGEGNDTGLAVDVSPTATSAYLALAGRYYYRDPVLIESTPSQDRALWQWNSAGQTYAERIVPREVPAYAYARLLAEDALLQAMKQKHPNPEVFELYVCNTFMHILEARASKAPAVADIQKMAERTERMGAEYVYLALQRALQDGNTALARPCIAALRNIGDSRRPQHQHSLMNALSYPNKFVRIESAETMMHLSPLGTLGDPEQIVYVLAAGLGVPAREVIAVLTDDVPVGEATAELVVGLNMVPELYRDKVKFVDRVKAGLPRINTLIIDGRSVRMQAPFLVQSIRRDARSQDVTIVLIASQPEAAELRDATAGDVVSVLTLPLEKDPFEVALRAGLAAATRPEQPNDVRDNQELLLRILQTAASLPPATVYPAQFLSEGAAGLLAGYPDEVRIPALQTITSQPTSGLRDVVYKVFTDDQEPLAVRQAAGKALLVCLQRDPAIAADQATVLRGMAGHSDDTLRRQTLHALSLARISQESRQKHLVEIVPNPTVAQ